MPESNQHMTLVQALRSYIAHTLLKGDSGYILVDLPESDVRSRPPKIGAHVPDVFVRIGEKDLLIIGEAKTPKDFERTHTTSQLAAFLRECSNYRNSHLVLAVPWDMVIFARSVLGDLKKRCNAESVHVHVLEKLIC